MKTLQNIVVGVDFSDSSKAALAQAKRLVDPGVTKLHLIHIVDSLVVEDLQKTLNESADQVTAEIRDHANTQFAEFLSSIEIDAASVDTATRFGRPFDELATYVDKVSADLLLLGTNGASNAARVGATASKCVRKLPCAVMLVRPDHTHDMSDVVACVDFSDNSRLVLEQATHAARRENAKLHVIHVHSAPWHVLHYRMPTPETDPRFKREYTQQLEMKMQDFLKSFGNAFEGVEMDSQLIDSTDPASGVTKYLLDHKADLVVLGACGRPLNQAVFLGSTAERLIHESPCSLVMIKMPGFKLSGLESVIEAGVHALNG